MRRPVKPALVHFYVDADVLGLAKVLVELGAAVTYPGDPGGPAKGGRVRLPCPIKTTNTRMLSGYLKPHAMAGSS
jgi:hypothetical protein